MWQAFFFQGAELYGLGVSVGAKFQVLVTFEISWGDGGQCLASPQHPTS